MNRATVLLAFILSLPCLTAPASAQTPPAGAEAAQCDYFKPFDASVRAKFEDLFLRPGATFDMATIIKDPSLAHTLQQIPVQEQARRSLDWAALCYYKAADATQRAKEAPRVVFLGDSITENWSDGDPTLFSDAVIDRGISGQTSSQILLRFYADVVALHPAVVHLMAGTNDLAQNEGPISDVDVLGNIRAMIDLAEANHIRVVLASIPPMAKVALRPNIEPAARVAAFNDSLRRLAKERGVVFVDYYDVLKDPAGGMLAKFTNDGVHPNRNGYAAMRLLAERAIAQAAQ